jgi:phosphoglycolate phosphatase
MRPVQMLLLFDLDGTLTDSRPGIARCLEHALADAGAAVPSIEELSRYVGPPLADSLASLLGTADGSRIERAIEAYRRRFEQIGMFENQLYPAIVETLTAFEAAVHVMSVVTIKPRVYARRILEHFEIARLFRGVYGPEMDARNCTKAALIRDACADAWAEAGRVIMIGDRAEDVHGARAVGAGAVAVAWGYGSRDELEAAGPDRIVASCGELRDYVGNMASDLPFAPVHGTK